MALRTLFPGAFCLYLPSSSSLDDNSGLDPSGATLLYNPLPSLCVGLVTPCLCPSLPRVTSLPAEPSFIFTFALCLFCSVKLNGINATLTSTHCNGLIIIFDNVERFINNWNFRCFPTLHPVWFGNISLTVLLLFVSCVFVASSKYSNNVSQCVSLM